MNNVPGNANLDMVKKGVFGCEWAVKITGKHLNYKEYYNTKPIDYNTKNGKVLTNWIGTESLRLFDTNTKNVTQWKESLHSLLNGYPEIERTVEHNINIFINDDELVTYSDILDTLDPIQNAKLSNTNESVTKHYTTVRRALEEILITRNVLIMNTLMNVMDEDTVLFCVRQERLIPDNTQVQLQNFLSTSYNWVGLEHDCFTRFGEIIHILHVNKYVRRCVVSPQQQRVWGQYWESEVILQAGTTIEYIKEEVHDGRRYIHANITEK